jgi:hypothetical protein
MESRKNDPERFTDKDLVKWGVILFVLLVYGYFYLKILFIE